MRIAVTGATGFVARNLRRSLRARHRVTALSRRRIRPAKGERAVRTDYADAARLASQIRGCDVLVHLVGTGRHDRRYGETNAGIAARAAEAAARAGVRQVIYLSGLGASASNPSEYFASKHAAEQAVRRSGVPYTIFRPSFITGKDDYLAKKLARQARAGSVAVPGDGRYVLQPVDISEAVHVIEESLLDRRFVGRTLDLVGPRQVTFESHVRGFCRGTGARIRRVPLDRCLHAALTERDPAYTIEDLCIFYGGYVGDRKGLERVLKARPRPAS